jgi:hypothetical protein
MRGTTGQVATLVLLTVGMLWMLQDAAVKRAAHQKRDPQVHSIVRLLGVADLALSSSSRWLRHPSITEPGAPFADSPALLDNDPAGAMISPPHEVLAGYTNVPGTLPRPPDRLFESGTRRARPSDMPVADTNDLARPILRERTR